METIFVICCTIVICVCVLARANIRITITHHGDTHQEVPTKVITDEEVTKAYEDLQKNPVPTFADVINVINEEFGGVKYEE